MTSERSEGEVAAGEKWDGDEVPVLLGVELSPDEEFEALFEEAAAAAVKASRKGKATATTAARLPSQWQDLRPRWTKVGFTLRVLRQECNCGSVHSVVEGLFREDAGRVAGERRLLRLETQEELEDFSNDSESPQSVETLVRGSVMCVECAGDYGFRVPSAEQPSERVDYTAPWPWSDGPSSRAA